MPGEVVATNSHQPLRIRSLPFYSRATTGTVLLVRCVREEEEALLTLPVA